MILTNTEEVPGRTIREFYGVVSGSTVRAKHIGKDFLAGLKNLVGGELKGYTELLSEARQGATARMVEEARGLGANAVVLEFATEEPSARASAAFSALLLSDLLEVRPAFRETADAAYRFYNTLKVSDNETEAFEHWLRSGWLNVARIADMLEFELTR